MWNKLFKKSKKEKQLNPSNNKSDTDVTETPPTTSTKCFSFLKGKKSKVDRYTLEDSFNHFLRCETNVYPESGEVSLFLYQCLIFDFFGVIP